MIGAIIGDVVGSVYEFDNIKTKEFPLFSPRCTFTDDTVMTVAVASALLRSRTEDMAFPYLVTQEMHRFGRKYPHAGYGRRFYRWLRSKDPEPYYSLGNGSAMRVSPCGDLASSLEEALSLAQASAEPTHDHPEGIKGAQAVAAAVYLARTGRSKSEIREYIELNFYPLDFTLDSIRPAYSFNETCPGSVPQAIQAFLESDSFEDAIRGAVSIGGDSDTIAAIAGSIAWPYYACGGLSGGMVQAREQVKRTLPAEFIQVLERFEEEVNPNG